MPFARYVWLICLGETFALDRRTLRLFIRRPRMRSNSSAATITTTVRSYLVIATGSALAASISSPKWFFAWAEVNLRIPDPSCWQLVLAKLDEGAMAILRC